MQRIDFASRMNISQILVANDHKTERWQIALCYYKFNFKIHLILLMREMNIDTFVVN